MGDKVNAFRVNMSFAEKVLGITVFNGKVVIAREDGVFMQDEDDVNVFRRVQPYGLADVMTAWPKLSKED